MTLRHHLFRFFKKLRVALLRGSRLPVFLGLLAMLLVQWIFQYSPPIIQDLLERLDTLVYDQRFNVVPGRLRTNEHNIIIVDLDQRSLGAEGQWPWSRFKLGDLVTQLANYGALVVGFDVSFPEHERNVFGELQQRLSSGDELGGEVEALLPALQELSQQIDGDRYFAASMQATDVVLGFSFRNNEPVRTGTLPEPIMRIDQTTAENISMQEMQGYVGNVDVLQQGARGGGFFDVMPDVDGVIRSSPLFMQFQNRHYPSLALDMARLFYFEDSFTPELEHDILGNFRELRGIRVGNVLIPTDEQGGVRVPYIGPSRSYPYISATDVLRGTLTPLQEEQLLNSLVLVGTTATGLYDLRATPVERVYPGVEVHANILNAILSSAPAVVIDDENGLQGVGNSTIAELLAQSRVSPFPTRPDWERGAVYVAILVIGLALALIYPHLGPGLLALSSITFMVGLTVLNFEMWSRYSLDVSLVILLLLILLITIVNMSYGFLREGLTRRAIKGMFDQYVPPAHIDAMLDNPDKYNFDGESKELSVLFSDIRNFTTISEKLTAAELKTLLNDFFTPITGIIFEYNGTIDKYVGDMVMAFWGAPLDDPEHRTHAVRAALKMLARAEELKPLFSERGLPEVNIGIGVNSGMMSVGDMGSTYRRSYTVLGDAVNLGSRLESLTKVYGVKLLIGAETYAGLTGILCRVVDKVLVKGKQEPVRIYQPLCAENAASEELRALVDEYNRAYDFYLDQQWDAAEALFVRLQQEDPDTLLYQIYLQRIADLRTQNLPANWDGTFQHMSK
jgi:adenylate cyclase